MKALLLLGLLVAGSALYLWARREREARAGTDIAAQPGDYARWQELYANASLEQVTQEIALLRAQLDEGTLDYYERQFANESFELDGHFAPNEGYRLKNPGDDLCARRFLRSGDVIKVVLPREEFPEMYELRDQIAWLSHREEELSIWGKP